ncbi:MAG: helix-turn-helix transcriptional regulator [Rhodospirillales bacterium]|nr:helix-turn-helix transcriptional regulator [Rhodospirillales bacterium]
MSRQDALDRTVASLNEAMLDDARWPEASALLEEVCGAKGNILIFSGDVPANDLDLFFVKCHQHGEDRRDWAREYFRLYHPADEHVPRLIELPHGKVVPRASLFSESERKTSPAYNEGLPRYDMRDGLTVRLDGPRGSRIVWGIGDPVGADGWTASQIEIVARVLPHLRQYVRVRSELAEAGALGASLAEFLDNRCAGVIQLDRDGRIVETNDGALKLLRRKDGLRDEWRVLQAVWREDDSRLQRLIARALPPPDGRGTNGSMTVRRSVARQRLVVHVMPVTSPVADYCTRRVAALVLIVEPVNRTPIEPELVEKLLGLTPAEARVAVLLAEGRTLRQIASATGRKYSTVRTHLKHLFAKLGASRQFEVVQAVLALSSLPRARD